MNFTIIVQEEPSGRGLAWASMITGKSYSEIKVLANGLGIYADDLRVW